MRYCALYECKICEYKACYYCLIDSSKRMLLKNITGEKEEEVKISSRHQEKKPVKKPAPTKENNIYTTANPNHSGQNSNEGAE